MKTLAERIAENRLSMRVTRAASNPNMEGSDFMDHWRCTIKSGVTGKRIIVTFSMGSAHKSREPELAEVLNCIVSDAAGWENAGTFGEWCSEYGYAEDSRKAENTYRAIERQVDQLTRLMADQYDALLWETERL